MHLLLLLLPLLLLLLLHDFIGSPSRAVTD